MKILHILIYILLQQIPCIFLFLFRPCFTLFSLRWHWGGILILFSYNDILSFLYLVTSYLVFIKIILPWFLLSQHFTLFLLRWCRSALMSTHGALLDKCRPVTRGGKASLSVLPTCKIYLFLYFCIVYLYVCIHKYD